MAENGGGNTGLAFIVGGLVVVVGFLLYAMGFFGGGAGDAGPDVDVSIEAPASGGN